MKLIREVRRSVQAMGWMRTAWALFWYPLAVLFLFLFACVVAITNLSVEEGVDAFNDAC